MAEKNYDSTIMRIAGNLLSGQRHLDIVSVGLRYNDDTVAIIAANAVRFARAIVAEVQRTNDLDHATVGRTP